MMDVNAYLDRIGIHKSPEPTLDSLRKLQRSHLLSVPFENLNIHIYNKLSSNSKELFEKIVLQRRGGICYELNYLYMLLLTELGYQVSLHGGRTSSTGTFFDHSFPIVEIGEKRYITDVGFGDNFLYPLEFKPDIPQKDPKGIFTVEYEGGGYYTIYKESGNTRIMEYTFTLNKYNISDFAERKIFYCTDERSRFYKSLICSRELKDGRVSLKQTKLLFTQNERKTYMKVMNFHHYINLLYDHFGIVLTPGERRRLKKSRFWNKRYNRRKTKALLLASSIQQTMSNKVGTIFNG
jgi:N-hydroxyarylamine O-acetyltransferase